MGAEPSDAGGLPQGDGLGLHEDKRSWEGKSPTSSSGKAAGSQEKVRCRRWQDKTGQEAKK